MRVWTPLAVLAGLGCLLAGQAAQAQVSWVPVPTDLPPSIELFETGATGDSLHAWYVRADLSDKTIQLDAIRQFGGTRTVTDLAMNGGVSVAVNGGFFSGTQSLSLVASSGNLSDSNVRETLRDGVPYYPTRGAIGRLATGRLDVAWIYDVAGMQTQTSYPSPTPNAPGAPQPRPTAAFPAGGARWNVEVGIGGGPVLVQNSRRQITWTEEVFFGTGIDTTTASARTVAGRTADGRLLLLVAEAPGLTLLEAADLMVSLGAVEALNLDGGPSSALWVDGDALLPGERPVVSFLLLRPRFYNDPVILDTGDACCYSETGAWAESPDSLFYGTTASRLNEAGTGQDRAVFTFTNQGDQFFACGPVQAWWSPGPDRATNVTFTLDNAYVGRQTFGPVDQTDLTKAGRWNTIGYAVVAGGDSLVVTDAATGTTPPAYISVDAVRVNPRACPANEGGPGAALGLAVAPNPARGSAAATFTLAAPADVRVSVVDLLGRTVRDERVRLAVGVQSVRIETAGLAGGLYVVRVEAGASVATARLAVVR